MTSFEFNLDSQRYLFQTELESFSQDGLHEQYLEIILSDVLFFYRHQQAMKAEAFTDFDLYKSLAHESCWIKSLWLDYEALLCWKPYEI